MTKYLINNITTNWKSFINNQLDSTYLQAIDHRLTTSKLPILPARELIFAAYNYFDIEATKVVLIGQDPYPSPLAASGLAFSSLDKHRLPASLRNIFKELELELGIKRTNADLSDWAQQGVLLLNTALTVYEHQAGSHSQWGWETLIEQTIIHLNQNVANIVFILLGKHAQCFTSLIDPQRHLVLAYSHPSPLAVNQPHQTFFKSNLFIDTNNYLQQKRAVVIKW